MDEVVLPVQLTASDQQVAAGRTKYWGMVVRETAGSTAVVRVYDGTSAAGILIDTVALAALDEGPTAIHIGIQCMTGVFVDIVSGTVEGAIFIG
jgi:hypothetical protein